MSKFDFVEIGTSYFHTEVENASDETVGLSVEPVKYYLDKLPSKPKCKKANVAISDKEGSMDLFYVPDEYISEYDLGWWVAGTSTLLKPNKITYEYLAKKKLAHLMTKKPVKVITFGMLADKYNVSEINYLKVDVEGHDAVVIQSMLDYCDVHNSVFPKCIRFEANGLGDKKKEDEVICKLQNREYKIRQYRKGDYVLDRN